MIDDFDAVLDPDDAGRPQAGLPDPVGPTEHEEDWCSDFRSYLDDPE